MTYNDLATQLVYVPEVTGDVPSSKSLILGAMGGSALAAEALPFLTSTYHTTIHRDYGISHVEKEGTLYVAISYSGNTEETVSFAKEAFEKGCAVAVVASGGVLIEFAKHHGIPYVQIPSGIVPRNAFLYLVRGLLGLLGEEEALKTLSEVRLNEQAIKDAAEQDAHFLIHGVPLFYTSGRNVLLGKLATCILAESARTPAFSNVFPEMNHNELQAFDRDMPEGLTCLFRMVVIRDEGDDPRILRRMNVFEKLMRERSHAVRPTDIVCGRRAEFLVVYWMRLLLAARFMAETRGIDSDTQPLIDEFKTRI